MDTLNALILLHRKRPGILAQRAVEVDVLDLDRDGPAFGEAALAALSQPKGPLHGLRTSFRHLRHDWAHPQDLPKLLQQTDLWHPVTICSSEGGLFEYGSDDEIVSNLKMLRSQPGVVAVAGSVTRADEPTQQLRNATTPKTRPRGC